MDKKSKFKFNKKILIISVVVLVLIIVAFKVVKNKKQTVKKVNIENLTRKNLVQTISDTGNVQANYRNDIILNPTQKVVKINVTEGQLVKKGDILIKLDEKDYQNQLKKAELNLKNSQDTLNQLQGQEISNQRENSINAVKQAEITLENAKNNYNDLKKKLNQNKTLYEGGYISKNDYEASQKAILDAENAIKIANVSLKTAQNNASNVNVSIGDKVTLQNNQIAIIKSEIDSLKDKINECFIKANVDGKVIKLDAKEGQYPKSGDMIVIDDVSKYKVSISMNQYDAVKIKNGQKADIKIKGLNKKYTGVVNKIGQVAKPKMTGAAGASDQEFNVDVDILINNIDSNIKAGYQADVEIIVGERNNALSIPFDSVIVDKKKNKNYVFVVDNNKKIAKKSVNLGIETDYDVEIVSGLKQGEKCVINPPEGIKEGENVEISNEGK